MEKKFYSRLYYTFIKPYILSELICFILILMYSSLNILFPYFFQLIIDDAIGKKSLDKLVEYIAIMVIMILLMLIFKSIQVRKSVKLGQKIVLNLKMEIIKKLSSYSKSFFNNYKVGDIVSIIENDVQSVEIITSNIINEFLVNVIVVIGLFFIILKQSYLIAMAAIALAIVYAYIQRLFGQKIRSTSKEVSIKKGQLLSLISDFFSRITDIKGLNCEDFYTRKYKNEQNQYFKKEYILATTTNSITIISTVFQSMGLVVILCFGGILVLNGNMSLGALFSLSVYIQRVYAPIVAISNEYINLKRAQASLDRIYELIDKTDTIIKDGNKCCDKINSIKVDNLTFSYTNQKLINGGSIYIKSGEKVALLGANGTGKTTLINLLLRIQEGYKGNIYYNDINIKEYKLDYLRRNIVCIGQEPLIFNGTVRENIVLDQEQISEKVINDAIQFSCLKDDIDKLENGIDTYISAKELSGGQKQKISLARLFVKNPSIIILDEPTAALDMEAEQIICRNIYNLFKEKTIITITHRKELLKYCDVIYELKNRDIVNRKCIQNM